MNEIWKSSEPELLPDFIIGGAMKSGTTTLHNILNAHPRIFIPDGEVHFFDMDNVSQHSDFNFLPKKKDGSRKILKRIQIEFGIGTEISLEERNTSFEGKTPLLTCLPELLLNESLDRKRK